jgi:hypothetical protein
MWESMNSLHNLLQVVVDVFIDTHVAAKSLAAGVGIAFLWGLCL